MCMFISPNCTSWHTHIWYQSNSASVIIFAHQTKILWWNKTSPYMEICGWDVLWNIPNQCSLIAIAIVVPMMPQTLNLDGKHKCYGQNTFHPFWNGMPWWPHLGALIAIFGHRAGGCIAILGLWLKYGDELCMQPRSLKSYPNWMCRESFCSRF